MKLLQALLCASVATNLGALFLAYDARGGEATQDVVRARRLEIVDENGELCVALRGSHQSGGAVALYYPRMETDDPEDTLFAIISSPFPGISRFSLKHNGGGPNGVSLSVLDKSPAVFSGMSDHGLVSIAAGRAQPDDAVIRITDSEDEELFRR